MNWSTIISNEFQKDYYINLQKQILESNSDVFPFPEFIFNAFKLCSFENTKVVIIGQDPYHGSNQAHGLSFSVLTNKLPPSLKNIFKELESDLNIKRTNGNLTDWAEQGVLLLNSVLTVMKGKPNSHKNIGWETFTDVIIHELNTKKEGLVFILWGNYAQNKAKLVDNKKHFIIKSSHPSPLSANRGGFFGSKPFSKCNKYLGNENKIKW